MTTTPGTKGAAAEHIRYGFHFAFEWNRPSDWNFQHYQIPTMTIWYILDGYRDLHVGQDSYELEPGDLLVLPDQAVITTRGSKGFSGPIHYLSLGLFFMIGARDWPEWYGIPIRLRPAREAASSEWLDIWRQLARRFALTASEISEGDAGGMASAASVTAYLEQSSLFQQWLAVLNRLVQPYMNHPNPELDQRLFHICNYIQSHYALPLTAKELAVRACLSEGHLRAIFRNSLRMSPYQYVIHVRLSMAKQMLLTTNQALQEIAYSVGFDDLSHFISLFRRKVGMTPAHYRRHSHWSV